MLFNLDSIQSAANNYTQSRSQFLESHDLDHPQSADHLAIKVADSADYDAQLPQLLKMLSSAQYVNLNNRRICTGKLITPITLPGFSQTNFLEILEPRPSKVGTGVVGLEHVEFLVPDLDSVKSALVAKNILPEFHDNGHHRSLIVKFNNLGQELVYTNTPLEQVLVEEQKNGLITRLK